jgi:outer membrane scaffolding protein for murein synthesis (MipA/OmpV family)
MKPDKPGIWEWFAKDGTKRLVRVWDNGVDEIWLRVSWWGGYYNVHKDKAKGQRQEWADRWGNYVGEVHTIPVDQLYIEPTKEEYEKHFKAMGVVKST